MLARYASFAASFLLVLAVGAVLAYVVHSSTAPLPTAASTATATATSTGTATATATATATPLLRAYYDVYLEGREGRTLRYVREPCTAADTALRFFARYYPVNDSDLEGERLYNSVGFGFSDRGTRSGGRCETTLEMPNYAIERVLTGQYGGDGAWREGFPLDAAAWRARYDSVVAGTLRLRSTRDIPWDVYLDGQTLTWISSSCSAEDTALRFFVRWYPADASNLEGERLYNDTGFGFTDRGLRYEGRCMAQYELPNYAIKRVLTGQYGGDGAWREGFPVDAAAWRARYGVVVAGTPRLRSTRDIPWDVHLDGNMLTWIHGACVAADTKERFFVRWYPADAGNLQGERGRTRGYNDTGFGFTDRGLRYEGKCMASFELPAYAVTRVFTGQYRSNSNGEWEHPWEGGFDIAQATATATGTATAPVRPQQ